MANKYLDLAGLEHLWDKIEDEVSTAADNAKTEAIASAAADATTKANNALSSAKTDTDNKLKSYLPLSGTATAAAKLSNTTAIGSATQPVYFSADGVPIATTYTLGASVPSGAVFTDEKVKLTAVAPTSNTYYYPVMHSATTGTTSLGTNSGIKVQMVTGTTSVTGFNQLVLGNNTASGTAGNQYGQITLYSSGTNGHTIIPASGTSNANHTLPATTGTILNTGTTSFTQTLTSGTEVGKIKINGTTTTLYAPTNTDTHYTTGLKVGASATATANAAATNGNVYLNVLDNTTVRDSHNIVGSGATTVTSDANGKITISSTNTTYNAATTSANGLMSSTDKSKLDYTNVAYANCSTAAGTAAKVATIVGNSNWKLTQGSIVTVYYNTSNTASSVTLNVNNTGAKEIYYGTAKYTGNSVMICGAANRCITYMYSGTYWVWISSGMDNNTTYSNFVKSGTGAKAGLVPAPSTTAGTTKFLCEDGTWAVPPDTDTHYTSHLYVGVSGGNANATTATSNPYLLCVDNTTNRNSIQLKAGTNMSVSAVNGVVTFTNSYSLPTASSTLGGVKTTSTVTSTSGYTACPIISGVPYYKDTNTDTKVTQTLINPSNTGNYPLLLAPTGLTATTTTTANFTSALYYTPSNYTIGSTFPINISSASTSIEASNITLTASDNQVQLAGKKGVVLTSDDGGSIAINGTTHIEGKLTANNIITGTKTITVASATAGFTSTNLTYNDLGFYPSENTSIVVSVRMLSTPSPRHLNIYSHYWASTADEASRQIQIFITNGASSQTTIPAGTYYIDYIVTNNA